MCRLWVQCICTITMHVAFVTMHVAFVPDFSSTNIRPNGTKGAYRELQLIKAYHEKEFFPAPLPSPETIGIRLTMSSKVTPALSRIVRGVLPTELYFDPCRHASPAARKWQARCGG